MLEDLNRGKDVNWVKILTRQITPQLMPVATAPKRVFPDLIGAGFESQLFVPKGKKHEFYLSGSEWGLFAGEVSRRLSETPSFARDHAQECVATCESIKAYSAGASGADIIHWSPEQLAAWYREYLALFDKFYLFLWTPHVIEEYLEGQLREGLPVFLEQAGEEDRFDDYFSVITTKVQPNLAEQEESELLELASQLDESEPQVATQLLAEHTRKWAWLPFYSLDMEPWSLTYFTDRARKVENVGQLLAERAQAFEAKKQRFNEVRSRLAASEKLAALVDIVQEYLFLRTDRADTLRSLLYNLGPFLKKVGELMNLSYDQIIYTTPGEVLAFLDSGSRVELAQIQDRQQRFLIVSLQGCPVTLVSDPIKVDRLIGEYLGDARPSPSQDIKITGTGVFRGVVQGRVRLVESREDWESMKEGEVLVTSMTTPEMLPVYSKAAAIITDEGGMTCHAAIVSRELQIPCIIGTAIATDSLQNGMTIHVDSEAGIATVTSQ